MRYDRRLAPDTYVNEAASTTGDTIRSGPLKELTSYPRWAQEMIESCEDAKKQLLNHELWRLMKTVRLDFKTTRNFLLGAWQVVDQFPQYMALNLLKVPYGRTKGQDIARRWLIRNMRVEQNHAKYWIDWAVACGIDRHEVVYGAVPPGTYMLSHWCWQCCERDSLAAAMATTNYALEGSTGEWASLVLSTPDYENSFKKSVRRKATTWLSAHAAYDDTHPWEALEIICTIMGDNPSSREVAHVGDCIRKTYEYKRLSLDHCFEQSDL
jgi:pyrroloquinoline quinone (PQQ) biosynthesis protein C